MTPDLITSNVGFSPAHAAIGPVRTKVNLRRHPEWQEVDFDPSGLPIVLLIQYCCDCGEKWEMAWSCECGDRCPNCDAENDAVSSSWIGPKGGEALWESLPDDLLSSDLAQITCGCGWTGDEGGLIAGNDAADGQYSDCLCPSCKSDGQLSGFDVLGDAA